MGEPITGKTIDIATLSIKEITVGAATESEIKDTVYVMGGSDWHDWIIQLMDNDVLNDNVKTISYTYVGGPATERIYRSGTMGQAKEDLENTAKNLNVLIKNRYQGEALISSSKAVVTKASVFIPQMPIYVACLYEVMEKHGVHETILQHKYRLFKDMVYGHKRIVDTQGRIRIDHKEMDATIQKEVFEMMHKMDEKTIFELDGTKRFLTDFRNIHGFGYDGIDYEADISVE